MTPARSVAGAVAVDLLREMLEIDSPSGSEARLARFLAGAMADLGLTVRTDLVGNVIGETGAGGDPTVLLVGHLDTVPGRIAVRREAGRLYGRGACDAKGPLAALVVAAAQHGGSFPGTLVVAGVVEEETPGSRGAAHLSATVAEPDALIVGEPGGWDAITLGYKGKLDLAYRVCRPPAHPARPASRASEVAAAFWADVVRIAAGGRPGDGHAAFDRVGVTLSAMRGDPESAELELSLRLPVGLPAGDLLDRLRAAVGDAQLDVLAYVDAIVVDHRSPTVRALRAAIRHFGGEPRMKLKSGTGDMNIFAQRWRTPAATYGPGDSRLDHTDAEHINVDDYLRGVSVLDHALADLGDAAVGPAAAGLSEAASHEHA